MALELIATLVGSLLEIPMRLVPAVVAYLLALMGRGAQTHLVARGQNQRRKQGSIFALAW